jgi:hypothetical protein
MSQNKVEIIVKVEDGENYQFTRTIIEPNIPMEEVFENYADEVFSMIRLASSDPKENPVKRTFMRKKTDDSDINEKMLSLNVR